MPGDADLVDRTLKKSGIVFEKMLVDNRTQYTKALTEFQPDVILSDHSLPAFNSLEALKILRETGIDIPFILITATVSEEFAVSVMKEGASDYILKDRLQRLPNAIINAIEKHQSNIDRQTYLSKIVASEALFTKAEMLAEFGTWRIDLISDRIDWSAGTYKLLGYEHGEVEPSYENSLKNIYPDDISQVEGVFKNAADNFQPTEIDFRVINKDGSLRYVQSQFEFELNEKGEPAFIIGFNQDVTRSKLAQIEINEYIEELKAASDRQSSILNALPPNIVLLNEGGKIVAVNESWRKFTLTNNLGVPKYGIGYSYIAISEKATGVDEITGKKIAKGIRELIAGQKNEFSMEYSCYQEHKKVWFQLIVAPLSDKTKKGAVVLHIDITDRKLAEELLLQSKANLQSIFENTDVAYVLCDSEHKIVSFNSKANELSIEEFDKKLKVGSYVFHHFPKSRIPNLREAIQKVTHNEMVVNETSYNHKDDTVKWYEIRWAGVANEKNENIGFVLAFKDISERKISDLEREKIALDLVQRNNDLEQFTYIVSHNLRAPVANILGLSNLINSLNFNINENQGVKVALSDSVNILDGMIRDLNQILQVRGNVNEKKEEVSFQYLVEDVRLTLQKLIERENVAITYNFNAVHGITTIKSYMNSIFYNLILNAIKYKRPKVNPSIAIFSRKNEGRLEILFKDNGKGIDEKNIRNLFGLYNRFDTSVEGKGMGLFMVKMQVETLGGAISVESELGEGTTFKLEFPM